MASLPSLQKASSMLRLYSVNSVKSLTRGSIIQRNASTSNSSPTPSKELPQLTLFTGTDCSLCDVAKEVLEEAKAEHPFELSLYNIRDDSLPEIKRWRRAYQYDIPVLHLEGKEIARHNIDKTELLKKLREAAQ